MTLGRIGTQHAVAALALAACVGVVGCASWDDDAFFPADFQDRYTKLHNCKKSTHPSGDWVVVWADPTGAAAMADGTRPLPSGSVLVKAQYGDSACSEPTRFTAMRKGAAGSDAARDDWQWQLLDEGGGVRECCDGGEPTAMSSCTGCHAACRSLDWVCTQP